MISDQGAAAAGFWSRSMVPVPMSQNQQKQLLEEEDRQKPRLLRAAIDLNVGVVDPTEIESESAASCRTNHGCSVDGVERSSSSAMAAVAAAGIWKEQLLAGWFPKWHDLFNGFLPNMPVPVPVLTVANSCASPPKREKSARLYAESSSTEADHLHTPEARVMADDCTALMPEPSVRTPASEHIDRHCHVDWLTNSPPPIPVPSPAWLPQGWVTELHTRRTGTTAGTRDKYYKELASGRRFRSRTEVFNFIRTGKGRIRSRRRKKLAFLAADSAIAGDTTIHAYDTQMQADTDSPAPVIASNEAKLTNVTINGHGSGESTFPNKAQVLASTVPTVLAVDAFAAAKPAKTETGDTASAQETQKPANNAVPKAALNANQMNLLLRRLETCNNNSRLRLVDIPAPISPVSPIIFTEKSRPTKMTEISQNGVHQQFTLGHKRTATSSPSPKSPSKTQLKKAKMESLRKSEAKQASRLWQWLHQTAVVRNHEQQQPPAKSADSDQNPRGDPERQMIDKKSCSDQKLTNNVQHTNGGSTQRTLQLSREIEEAQKSMMEFGREMQASVEKMSKELQKLSKESEQVTAIGSRESNLAISGDVKSEPKQRDAFNCDREKNETQKGNGHVNMLETNSQPSEPNDVRQVQPLNSTDISILLSNSKSMVANRQSNVESVISMDDVLSKVPKPAERSIVNLNRSIVSFEINLNQKPDFHLNNTLTSNDLQHQIEGISIDNQERNVEAIHESPSSKPVAISKQSSNYVDKQRHAEARRSNSHANKERNMEARHTISDADNDRNVEARCSSSHADRDRNIEAIPFLPPESVCIARQFSSHVDDMKGIHSLPSECKGIISRHGESRMVPDEVMAKTVDWPADTVQSNTSENSVKEENCLQIDHAPCIIIDVEKPCTDAAVQMCNTPSKGIHRTLQVQQNLARSRDAAVDDAIHEDQKAHSTDLVVINADTVNSTSVLNNGSSINCSSSDEIKNKKLLSTTRSRGADSRKCKMKRRNLVLNPKLDLSGLNPNLTSRQRAKVVQKMKAAHARELLASLGRKICRTLPVINNI